MASSILAEHALTHVDFSQSKVQCEVCGKWVKNKNTLRTHKLTHSRTPLSCPHCEKIKYNKRALQSHVQLAHSTKKYQCKICPKSFSRPKMLRVRLSMIMNSFERIKLSFNIIQFDLCILQEHEATHTKTMLYDCSYCSLKFRNYSNMCTHIRGQHTNEWIRDREKKQYR